MVEAPKLNVKDGDSCKVVKGAHAGKSGIPRIRGSGTVAYKTASYTTTYLPAGSSDLIKAKGTSERSEGFAMQAFASGHASMPSSNPSSN